MSRLKDLMDLSHVPRWVTHPVARPQSVAEHSYRVAVLALEIQERLPDGSAGARLSPAVILRWALVHDGPEAKVGDIPSPVKQMIGRGDVARIENVACDWYMSELDRPSPMEYAIVHLADTIEALSWVSRYGSGFRDRFDNHNIEHGLRERIYKESKELDESLPGLFDATQSVLGEVAP